MATISNNVQGSIFMGNPIVYTVTAATPVDSDSQPKDVNFHRVKMSVVVQLGIANTRNKKSYLFSSPAENGSVLEFDISSAFRAFAETHEYTPITAEGAYPYFSAAISAWDSWMEDGELQDNKQRATVSGNRVAILGKYSDFERITQNSFTVDFSRKPLTGELACVGDNVVYAVAVGDYDVNAAAATAKIRTLITSDANTEVSLLNSHKVFALPASYARNSRMFQFVNSRGVVESIRAWSLDTEKMKSKNEEFAISRIETFSRFARTLSHKQANHEELTLCSGFVTYQWARWWMDEFCQSEQHWMLHDGIWIPCNVTIEDTATLIDRTKSQMCYVSFTCRPNTNGLLM